MIASMIRRLGFGLLAALPVGAMTATGSQAHPHVWVDAATAVLVEDGHAVGLRHGWLFDKDYAAAMLAQYDTDNNGKLSPDELAPLDELNKKSLKDFSFFTVVRRGDHKVGLTGPHNYKMTYVGGQLAAQVVVRFDTPVPVRELQFELYDQTFFTVFTFLAEQPIQVEGMRPDVCSPSIKAVADGEHHKQLKLFTALMGAAVKGKNLGTPQTVSMQCKSVAEEWASVFR